MNEALISVIVPVYNVEKYLKRCIDSIINQTYTNLEILLVDDGSTDASSTICEEYAKKDSRIRLFHKINGGQSSARNLGIERAVGEYFIFVDSDDYVDKDYVEFLYRLINDGEYSLACCSLHIVYESNGRIVNNGTGKVLEVSSQKALEMLCYDDRIYGCVYAKLYHRDLFRNVRFPEGKLFEDIGTIHLLIDQCEQIICGFIPKYWYAIRSGSTVTSLFSEKNLDIIEMTDRMCDYIDDKYPDLSKATLRRRGYARFSVLNKLIESNDSKYSKLQRELVVYLKSKAFSICLDTKTPVRDKLAYFCLQLGHVMYVNCWKLYLLWQRG